MTTKQELHDRVEHDLTLHPPTDPAVGFGMDEIRRVAKDFAHCVIEICPRSREQSLALTDIENATQHAIAGIARNQEQYLADQRGEDT